MLLISHLPLRHETAPCHQVKQVEWIEAHPDRLVHHKDVAEVLFSAADLIAALEYQDTIRLQHSVGFRQCVPVESVELVFVWKDAEPSVYNVA